MDWIVLLALGGCARHAAAPPAPGSVESVEPTEEPPTPAPSAQLTKEQEAVFQLLLPRDPEPVCAEVEAGLADPVGTLLVLAERPAPPPWVGMRAANCLVDHAAEPAVEVALMRWVSEEDLAGLGLLAVNLLDRMPEEVAMRVAAAALEGPISDRARDEIAGSSHQAVRAAPAVSFVQIEFAAFFLVVYAIYWSLRRVAQQNVLLVLASAVFYGWVHPWFVALLYAACIVDFSATNLMAAFPRRRTLFLWLSVGCNLGLLGFFKYFDFFVANFGAAARSLGLELHPAALGILLPVGISFYTFQTIGYAVDVWRGEVKPRTNFLDYLAYVSFFPQLVAGPIERAGRLLPQFERPRTWSATGLESGISLILWGAVKKVVIADSLAPYVDKVFALRDPAGSLIWAATAAFMIQIFADFSGYTDLARGTARLLGFELMENFREPFLATSVSTFWQRWHISLSSWVRDYLLLPLLGPHPGRVRFAAATLLTFAVIGLWHGPSWNFLLFGLYHGFWTVVQGLIARPASRLTRVPGWWIPAIVFQWTVVGLVGSLFFRESSLTRIVQHLGKDPRVATEDEWVATTVVVAITALAIVPLVLDWAWNRWIAARFASRPWYVVCRAVAWTIYGLALWVFWRVSAQDFVYFQF